MINILLTIGLFLIIFICTEILIKKYKVNADITRKVAHILSGVVVFFLPYYLTRNEIVFISILFVIFLLFTRSVGLIKSIHSVERKTHGEIYFPLGVAVVAILFLPHDVLAFQFGILVMAISDALAALIGIPWGKHPISVFKGKKSLEGSVTFFVSSVLIWLFFYKQIDYKFIAIPFLLTITELVLSLGLDNLLLPSVAAYLFTIFR